MEAVKFKQSNHNLAENQDEYNTLPVFGGQVGPEPQHIGIIACFELSEAEVANIVAHKKLWYRGLTFGNAVQPFNIFAVKDYFEFDDSYPDLKEFKEEVSYFNDTTFKPTFWQRIRMLFGASLIVVYEIKSKGFLVGEPKVQVKSKYTWKL